MHNDVHGVGGLPVCSRCGAKDFRHYKQRGKEKARCRACLLIVPLSAQQGVNYITDPLRVLWAVDWLCSWRTEGITRREIADHLQCSKSPALVSVLDALVASTAVRMFRAPSARNGREVVYYAHWTMATTPLERWLIQSCGQTGDKPPVAPWEAARANGGR